MELGTVEIAFIWGAALVFLATAGLLIQAACEWYAKRNKKEIT